MTATTNPATGLPAGEQAPRSRSGTCTRCRRRVRYLNVTGTSWRFDPTPVDHHDHASPPAYPIWRNRAWPVGDLTTHLVEQLDRTEKEAQLTIENCPWLLLHVCPRGGPRR